MYTTIKITAELKNQLEKMKMRDSESYQEIIEDMIEDKLASNPKFLEEIEESRKQIKKGEFVTLEELKRRRK